MTIEELISKLQLGIKYGTYNLNDNVKYRQLDENRKLFHNVDYFTSHKDEPNTIIFCEEWL